MNVPDLTEDQRNRLMSRGDRRFFAYYFGFDPTGDPDIDMILAAVACAGKAFHSTEDWTDPMDWDDRTSPSWAETIESAAHAAARNRKAAADA